MEADRLGNGRGLRFKVLLDTNFLIYLAEGRTSKDSLLEAIGVQAELVTTRPVVDELRAMASKEDKLGRAADAALRALTLMGVTQLESAASADDSLFAEAIRLKERGYAVYVATNDGKLRKRLRSAGVPTLYLSLNGRVIRADWLYPL